ncbi:MAG: GTPase, partial [Nocardioidaceae bacterium]
MPSGPDDWLRDQFARVQGAGREVRPVQPGQLRQDGVGKSTLVNAIFGEEVAATGIGEPVTREAHLYVHSTEFLGVYDTRGIEVGVDNAK